MIHINAVADMTAIGLSENIPKKNKAADPLIPISVNVKEGITELTK